MGTSSVVWRPRKTKTTEWTGPIVLADEDTHDTGQKRHRRVTKIDHGGGILRLSKITSWITEDNAVVSGGGFYEQKLMQ